MIKRVNVKIGNNEDATYSITQNNVEKIRLFETGEVEIYFNNGETMITKSWYYIITDGENHERQ